MELNYDLRDIKFAIDQGTFERAVGIYESNGIKDFQDNGFDFSARIKSSRSGFYDVYVSVKDCRYGGCNCYWGERGIFCKHMAALAIYTVKKGEKLTKEEKKFTDSPQCSGRRGELSEDELKETKAAITAAMRYIKPYNGPSRTWFTYQSSLSEGVSRLADIVSNLPVSKQTADLLVGLLLRLDRKLSVGGVDDSDGVVGGFIMELVSVLKEFVKINPFCSRAFKKLQDRRTCFDWEEELIELLD